jgi:tetratricopeptide (TPR) repeat protein
MRRAGPICLLLNAATLAAYWPLHQAQFINFDDPLYVTDNPVVSQGLSWPGMVWAFTKVHASNWHPLTWLSHMADCSFFGVNPMGPHLVNVGFHVSNSLILLALLCSITKAPWRSGFVASLFALHPLHVESVAWIAERKDLLSTLFGLLSLLAYARYVSSGRRDGNSKFGDPKSEIDATAKKIPGRRALWYALALTCFVFGLLSKPMLVTLPFVMLLLDFWPLGRFPANAAEWRGRATNRDGSEVSFPALLREKLPFFALSAASSAVTFWAQKSTGAMASMETIPLRDRLANGAVAYVTYLTKTFWPTKLALPYPFVLNLPVLNVALAAACLLGLTIFAITSARRAPFLLMGWFWFLGTLIPVIGLAQVGGQAMADRYTYIPLIGVFIIVAWGAVALTKPLRFQRPALALFATLILACCFVCTRLQAGSWQDSLTLFSHAVQVTKHNPVAEEKLGYTLALSGNLDEAIRHFDAALRDSPTYEMALVNRAHTLLLQGHVDDAIAEYREAIRNHPDSEPAYYQLAGALTQQRKWDEATTNYVLALRCNPDSAEAHTKLGNLLWRQNDHAAAMPHLYEAVRLRPDYAEAQYNLGNALAQHHKTADAAFHLRAALKANPNYAPALNDLAWILVTQNDPAIRNVPQGIRLAKRACELTQYQNAWLMDTLGVAQSEAGDFSEAIRITEQAAALADAVGDQQTAAGLRNRLTSYRKGEPYDLNPR